MSPWVLKFPMCYCLCWRHGGITDKKCEFSREKFSPYLKTKWPARNLLLVVIATRWFTSFLEPRLLARKPIVVISTASNWKRRPKNFALSPIQTNMSYATSQNVMPFVSELRATGHGEVWDHTDEKKLQQFGWRCTNTESSYDTKTLIGNWNEQRFDINRISKPKPIPSRVRWIWSLLQSDSPAD